MLTDPACKNALCPADKNRVRFADAGGLYLEVTPNGAKRWFWKYRFGGKKKRLALGNYSDPGSKAVVVGLEAAREAATEARRVLKTRTDPVQRRKADSAAKATSAATTFKAVALEYHGIKAKSGGWSATHAVQWPRQAFVPPDWVAPDFRCVGAGVAGRASQGRSDRHRSHSARSSYEGVASNGHTLQ